MADDGSWTLEGRTCLVTGATSGIGQETALALAKAGARVLIVGRDPERGARARDAIAEAGGGEVELLLADLASLAQIRSLAEQVAKATSALHVLVNNAGIVNTSRKLTADGLEATLAVNHLAYFLLVHELRDLLVASAPARIVNVASDAHRFGAIHWDDLQSERRYGGLPLVGAMQVYGASKRANILFTVELASRLAGTGVTANCLHPGAVATRLGQNNGALGQILTGLLRPFFLTPAQGAETSIHLATAQELREVSGRYFAKKREAKPADAAIDAGDARRLWEESARLLGIDAG